MTLISIYIWGLHIRAGSCSGFLPVALSLTGSSPHRCSQVGLDGANNCAAGSGTLFIGAETLSLCPSVPPSTAAV